MEHFIYNGINSNDIGIVVKEMPPVAKAEKNIESISVSGRNGEFHIDDGTYKAKNYKIRCVLMDLTKLDYIKSLYDGTGLLELSTELNKEYKATISSQVDFPKYFTSLKEFTLSFNLYPIAYSKTAINTTYTTNSNFTVGGNFNVAPKITIIGTGTITLNNTQIAVTESGITIDCDLMNCTKDSINKNDKVNLDDFPTLVVGNNSLIIGSGIESVTINYKEGWL